MKSYTTNQLRNVALLSHGGAGKTSVAEAMLFSAKAVTRLGRVDDGTSVMDHDPEEVRRKISISTSTAPIEWADHKINVLDTPGYFDFAGDVIASLKVAEGAVLVVCASSGVEVGTEKAWDYLTKAALPRMIFVNKMERENANFDTTVESLQQFFGNKVVPIQIPIGSATTFKGFVDLVKMKAFLLEGKVVVEKDIPADMQDQAETYREAMIDAVAASDDDLAMKYLEGEDITSEEIEGALGLGTKSGEVVPVLCGSASANIGIAQLMDNILYCLPSPSDTKTEAENTKTGEVVTLSSSDPKLCALVYKTMADPYVGKLTLFKVLSGVMKSDSMVYNTSKGREERIGQLFMIKGKEQIAVSQLVAGDLGAVAKLQDTTTNETLAQKDTPYAVSGVEFPKPNMTMAVEAKAKGDEEKIGSGLTRLSEEDPTFSVRKSPDTGQTVISGLGDLHLEIMCSRLQRKFGVEVELSTPIVPYKETVRGTVKMEGKHKKQSGGRGQFGHVWIELGPKQAETEDALEFVDNIFGGSVPRQYIPAVEKGVRETMADGVLAGYKVENVRVSLYDGSYHDVDSSEMAFKIAASMAFKQAFVKASPILLEPIMNVEITVPDQFMGDVMGDLNKKRGRIMGMAPEGSIQVIKAQVPMAEMFRYAIDLRSITQGRGSFAMEESHYEEVPALIAEQVIAKSKQEG